jgi:hypothetical protein
LIGLSANHLSSYSISRAYEGYRREAARIDEGLEARLLSSALDRLDEEPLRLVDASLHSSPLHEALSSDVVKKAFKQVPDFLDEVRLLAADRLTKNSHSLGKFVAKPLERISENQTNQSED